MSGGSSCPACNADAIARMERELARRELGELEGRLLVASLAAFVDRFWSVVTGAPLVRNRAIDAVVDVLQRVADGELHRVLIALPSGVGKSTMLALYAAWRLARNASHRAIHMTHAFELAATESRRVRRLVESDEYRAAFPHVQLRTDESTVAAWATTRDGRYLAVGQDSALLGRRAHEAVLDDPLDAGDRFSRTARESLWTWFEESLMTRLDGDRAPVIVVHQRLCLDDLIGRLAEQRDQHGNPVWQLLELPAEDGEGNLLAPTVLTRSKLDELRARNPRVYKTMFLMAPDADDGAAISRTAWRFYAPAHANPAAPRPAGCATHDTSPTVVTPAEFDRTCISVDMTFGSTSRTGDFCSITVWSAAGPHRFLRERWTKKATQREQRDQIRRLAGRYPEARILIEKAAGGAGTIEELVAEGITRIEPVLAVRSKAERLEIVSPTIELGCVYLPLGMVELAEFVECLAGATRHDDDQDSTSQALHWLNVQGSEAERSRWRALAGRPADERPAMRRLEEHVRRGGAITAGAARENLARIGRGPTDQLPTRHRHEHAPRFIRPRRR